MKYVTAGALVLCIAWQAVVYLLSSMGIFGDLYELLGIPWNATGLQNVLGTTLCLVILESPVVIYFLVLAWWRRGRGQV